MLLSLSYQLILPLDHVTTKSDTVGPDSTPKRQPAVGTQPHPEEHCRVSLVGAPVAACSPEGSQSDVCDGTGSRDGSRVRMVPERLVPQGPEIDGAPTYAPRRVRQVLGPSGQRRSQLRPIPLVHRSCSSSPMLSCVTPSPSPPLRTAFYVKKLKYENEYNRVCFIDCVGAQAALRPVPVRRPGRAAGQAAPPVHGPQPPGYPVPRERSADEAS